MRSVCVWVTVSFNRMMNTCMFVYSRDVCVGNPSTRPFWLDAFFTFASAKNRTGLLLYLYCIQKFHQNEIVAYICLSISPILSKWTKISYSIAKTFVPKIIDPISSLTAHHQVPG